MNRSTFSTLVAFLLFTAVAQADESAGAPVPPAVGQGAAAAGSAAQFDKRLPPVLPGEEIKTGTTSMKVWSTSGGVAVAPAPKAPTNCEPTSHRDCQDQKLPQGVGVIVDTRGQDSVTLGQLPINSAGR